MRPIKESLYNRIKKISSKDIIFSADEILSATPSEEELTQFIYGDDPCFSFDEDDYVCDLRHLDITTKIENLVCDLNMSEEDKKDFLQENGYGEYFGVDVKAKGLYARRNSKNEVFFIIKFILPSLLEDEYFNDELYFSEVSKSDQRKIAICCGYYTQYESLVKHIKNSKMTDADIERRAGIGYEIGDFYPKNVNEKEQYAFVVSLSPFIICTKRILNGDTNDFGYGNYNKALISKPKGHEDENWYLPTTEELQTVLKNFSKEHINEYNSQKGHGVYFHGWTWVKEPIGRVFARKVYTRDMDFSLTEKHIERKTKPCFFYKFLKIDSLSESNIKPFNQTVIKESMVHKIKGTKITDEDINNTALLEIIKDFIIENDNNGDTSNGYNQFYNFNRPFKFKDGFYDRISVSLKSFKYGSDTVCVREKNSIFLHRWDEEYEFYVDSLSSKELTKILKFLNQDIKSSSTNESLIHKIKKVSFSDIEQDADLEILDEDIIIKKILNLLKEYGEPFQDDSIKDYFPKKHISIDSIKKISPVKVFRYYRDRFGEYFLVIGGLGRNTSLSTNRGFIYGEEGIYSSNLKNCHDITKKTKKKFLLDLYKGLKKDIGI